MHFRRIVNKLFRYSLSIERTTNVLSTSRRIFSSATESTFSSRIPTITCCFASPRSSHLLQFQRKQTLPFCPQRNATWYIDKRISESIGISETPELNPDVYPLVNVADGEELVEKVNRTLMCQEQGRLFAVVSIAECQRKVTVEDILHIESTFPPTVGDRIRLEKVLVVGGKDFTLVGQPLLSREQVTVEGTVIEKTLSHNKISSTYVPRKRYRKLKLYRMLQTMIVINRIDVSPFIQQ